MRFTTEIPADRLPVEISLNDSILVLGSCFADNIGAKMHAAGFDVCVNPFGTLYNPASVASSLERLESRTPFDVKDCVEMGAGAGLICSFSHHTSFARETKEEFLSNANEKLLQASDFWHSCNKVIITFGTAMVWERDGIAVSNCLKRPAAEFGHRMLSLDEAGECIRRIKELCKGREAVFTVSPIRHLSLGAHNNTLSKATLHLALGDECCFPSYEILNDELRDYRFYADDLCHPSAMAVEYIWEKFVRSAVPESEWESIRANEKAARRSAHRPMR